MRPPPLKNNYLNTCMFDCADSCTDVNKTTAKRNNVKQFSCINWGGVTQIYVKRSGPLSYTLFPFQTPESFSALVGIHLKKEKSCLKKGHTSLLN